MSNVSDKSSRHNQNTHLCSRSFFLKNVSLKGYVGKKVQLDGPQMITRYSTEKKLGGKKRSLSLS